MLDKIIDFLEQYCYTEEAIKKVGKYKTVSACMSKLIRYKYFTTDELRKKLSIYIKRIVSEREFYQLLDYDRVEFTGILYEV